MKAAYDGGIRYFDCAPLYGFGKAEYNLGHALRELGICDEVTVSTKVGRVLKATSRTEALDTVYGIDWVEPLPFLDTYDYTYDGFMRSFEDSQKRLALDHIDILYVHDLGSTWHGDQADVYWKQIRDGGYRALDELRSSGAVKAVGLGVNETEAVVTVAREFDIDCAMIAGRYSLLNHAPLEGAFDELRQRGVSVVAAGVFNSGVLASGVKNGEASYDYGDVPEDIAKKVAAIEDDAAALRSQTVADQPGATFNADLAVNIGGALSAVKAVAPAMAARKAGTILLTGGGFGLEPNPDFLSLSIGKAGIRALALGQFEPFRAQGVHIASVTVVAQIKPGSTEATAVGEHFWQLHTQAPDAWTPEATYAG